MSEPHRGIHFCNSFSNYFIFNYHHLNILLIDFVFLVIDKMHVIHLCLANGTTPFFLLQHFSLLKFL